MELEVGYELIPLVDADSNGELLDRIKSVRRQFALEMGFIVPPLHIRDNLQLKSNEYGILIKGVEVSRPTGPDMIKGVRASSIRIESTSSIMAYQ